MRARDWLGVGNRKGAGAFLAIVVAACGDAGPYPGPGVSWELAAHRARTVSDIRYQLEFDIPEAVGEPIRAFETVRFTLAPTSRPLVLDFNAPPEHVRSVRSQGTVVPFAVEDGHIIIPAGTLSPGDQSIAIDFDAGNQSLNRNRDFLYTLFVPDRASTAFPCFDQPNLKAVYELTVTAPPDWEVVANGPLASKDVRADRITFDFAPTARISTYHFSFAAGRFQVESTVLNGRAMRMYHRETDTTAVQRNRDAIFDLHATALDWLEAYTDIPYPFDKFDFVLVPAFQYGGMEHPGAVLYRATSLLLDESATQNQLLGRASLIAHETAHMWFGNLVTMNWFDDVWTKEVFANFMAAKVVNPSFPEIDHELNFFLRHYPAAYAVDRTAGANPIRQPLENLAEAGTLYGAIVYQKAPIVMRQLERLIGPAAFQAGMRDYLARFPYGNATWPDLVALLDQRTDANLEAWSDVWVDEPDRPTITSDYAADGQGGIRSLTIRQADPAGRGRVWDQQLRLLVGWRDSSTVIPVRLDATAVEVVEAAGLPMPQYVLAAAEGVGYGLFTLDGASRDFLLDHLPSLRDADARSAAWVTLWDGVLHEQVEPEPFLTLALRALPLEDNELNVQRILGYLTTTYWRLFSQAGRAAVAVDVEGTLWSQLQRASTTSRKAAFYNTFVSTALTDRAVDRLVRIWQRELEIPRLPLAERDYSRLAQSLAVRDVPRASEILREQAARISNPDRKAEFTFVLPALSADTAVRDSFFAALHQPENREHEPWVLRGITLLHHPLRAAGAEHYILPSLELLQEIQQTGDIFFPKRWLDATFGGHNSPTAAMIVRTFLAEHPDYPKRLRQKILQSADLLFRAAHILHEAETVPTS